MTEPDWKPRNYVEPEPAAPVDVTKIQDWNQGPKVAAQRRSWKTPAIVLSVVAALGIVGIIAGQDHSGNPAAAPAPAAYVAPSYTPPKVVYSISGSFPGGVSVTMQAPTGTVQSEFHGAGIVGTYTFDPGSFVYLSAQNESDSGSITCTVKEDGQVISTNTSTGAYVIAQCDGQS